MSRFITDLADLARGLCMVAVSMAIVLLSILDLM
jgi:hypothetical protein